MIVNLRELLVKKNGETKGTKEFLEILIFFKEKKYSDMITVIELALEEKRIHKESIKLLYETLTEKRLKIEEVSVNHLESIANFTLPSPDINKFDALIEEKV